MSHHPLRHASAALLIGAVRLYQWVVRPLLGHNCRFIPSCSDYAVEAIAGHGAGRGTVLALARIGRCNPWCQGGHDPVPPRVSRPCPAPARP